MKTRSICVLLITAFLMPLYAETDELSHSEPSLSSLVSRSLFAALPEDIAVSIHHDWLPTKDRVRLWTAHGCSSDQKVWEQFLSNNRAPIRNKAQKIFNYIAKKPFKGELIIPKNIESKYLDSTLSKNLNVTRISFEWESNITDSDIHTVVKYYPNLTTLNLTDCEQLTDASIIALAEKCPNLRELYLRDCDNITDIGLIKLADNCLNLRILYLTNCHRITDAGIRVLAEKCPNLQALDLSYSYKITDASIIVLAEKCPNLRELYLRDCDNIIDETKEALRNKNIRY
ncbi:MAG: leucine-rich repeat domain-containing protein [Candidatus Paracaedibacteraceae bacterium]|nr:leucine-rich repeat domain-containing protein [Candidatus Paracaedibacteraceae bacterium]